MRTSPISHAIGLALLGGLLSAFAPSAFAQDSSTHNGDTTSDNAKPANDKAKNLDGIVVTARSGVETRTKAETSYSITTIDEDRLRMQAPTSVTEALKSVPGFWVEASGGEASGNIRARGIPVDGFGSVTLLEDGVPVQHDPALGYLNADQAFRLDETIERIEVVRGGPSSVFYSNAPAGAINFIPRKVGDTAEGIAKFTVGDYGLTRGDFWYGTPVGDGWKLGVGGFYRIDTGIRSPGFNANDGGQIRVNLARDFERGHVSVDVKHMDDKVALYLGIPMRTYPGGDIKAVPGFDGNFGTLAGPETEHASMKQANGGLYDFDNSQGTHVKRDQITLKFDYDLGDGWKLAESLRYDDTRTQRNGMFPNSLMSAAKLFSQVKLPAGASGLQLRYVDNPAQVFDNANQNGNGLVVVGGLRGVTMPVKELISDSRLLRQFELGGQTHDVTLGYYYARFDQGFSRYSSSVLLDTRDQARLLDLVALNAAGQPVSTLTDRGVYQYGYEWAHSSGISKTNAFYLSDEWQVTDQLRIDGGARWEQVNTRGNSENPQTVNLGSFATSKVLTGSGVLVPYDHTFSKLGWTLGANWQFSPRSGVFARWTPTFRLPNLSSYITNPGAKPVVQTMKLGEVGYKYSDRWLELYATAFYTKYDNVGYSNTVFNLNNITTVQQGYASSKTKGLELDGTWFPVDWFDLQVTATWQDPQYKGLRFTDNVNNSPVVRDYDGNQLIRVPKESYRVVPGVNLLGGRLRMQVSYEHEGQRYVDNANTVRLPAYDVWNASARYNLSSMCSLYFYVDNITNSLGLTEGNPRAGELQSADAGANTFIARPILGRAYRAAIMYRF
ncbi:TonB-dependent receptor [Dyella subtropica]|uniref:TonB-dependent receptor n=1 Tax=Dyella subtropica TaxID=2992127 RepID=UPI0022504BF9|nr:TonB-dependent receptor [Dyella subtropica]